MRRVLATEHGKALHRQRHTSSSPCSATPNTTAASPASTAAAEPPSAPNGGSAWPPTTCSSSTTTTSPARRPDGRPPAALVATARRHRERTARPDRTNATAPGVRLSHISGARRGGPFPGDIFASETPRKPLERPPALRLSAARSPGGLTRQPRVDSIVRSAVWDGTNPRLQIRALRELHARRRHAWRRRISSIQVRLTLVRRVISRLLRPASSAWGMSCAIASCSSRLESSSSRRRSP